MNWKDMRKKGVFAALALAVLFGVMLCKGTAITVRAEEEDVFSIQAEQLPVDEETYNIRLSVENQGEDWEGTVRLIVEESYKASSAYDIGLSLPQGSKKQFEVKVPLKSVDNTDGTILVTLLDSQGEEIMEQKFPYFLSSLSMGILSDSYSDLTFMDMGGLKLEFYDTYHPIRLIELQQGSLADELGGLTFLVIDRYDTGILTEEEKDAIRSWITDGGVLLMGSGPYAENTMRGFEKGNRLGFSYEGMETPEEIFGYDILNNRRADVDWSQLALAQFQDTTQSMLSATNPYDDIGGWIHPWGEGSVCVLSYSLTELGRADDFYTNISRENFVMRILNDASDFADSRYYDSVTVSRDNSAQIRNMLEIVGNSHSNSILNFNVLKGLVVLYVIFAGPVLYLILSRIKRRELYWIAVPVTAFFWICLIFFAGRGFEVVNAKAYSVTVKNLPKDEKSTTYLYCYDAGRSEWELRLKEGCEYVGSLGTFYSSGNRPYYYHIKEEGDIFSLGVYPLSNFEDSYFYLSSTGNDSGTEGDFLTEGLWLSAQGPKGTVTNDTNKDMAYFAVLRYDEIYIYDSLPAGDSCTLSEVSPLYKMPYETSYNAEIYDTLQDIFRGEEYGKASALSALWVGIYDVDPKSFNDKFVIIGVVEDWDKTVDDKCNEISYGCLYSIQRGKGAM